MTKDEQHADAVDRFNKLSANAEDGSLAHHRELHLREVFTDTASALAVCTEPGREFALALTKLEESFAWALRGEPSP